MLYKGLHSVIYDHIPRGWAPRFPVFPILALLQSRDQPSPGRCVECPICSNPRASCKSFWEHMTRLPPSFGFLHSLSLDLMAPAFLPAYSFPGWSPPLPSHLPSRPDVARTGAQPTPLPSLCLQMWSHHNPSSALTPDLTPLHARYLGNQWG